MWLSLFWSTCVSLSFWSNVGTVSSLLDHFLRLFWLLLVVFWRAMSEAIHKWRHHIWGLSCQFLATPPLRCKLKFQENDLLNFMIYSNSARTLYLCHCGQYYSYTMNILSGYLLYVICVYYTYLVHPAHLVHPPLLDHLLTELEPNMIYTTCP